MDGEATVEAYGVYVPRLRVDASEFENAWGGFEARGVEEKRVPEADEDAVTMAVEAIEDALDSSSHERDDVGTLVMGTTTPPLEEGDVGAQVAEIVGFGKSVEVVVHSQSARAGVRSVLTAASAAEDGEGVAIAVAADCPFGTPDDSIDHAGGAGAVAFVVCAGDDDCAVSIEETASYTQEFSGTRFRERGEKEVEKYGATAYERDAYTTVVSEAFGAAVDDTDANVALAPTAPDADMPYRAGRETDAEVYETASSLGDTGAASALFGILKAWKSGEEEVIAVGYGDGASADAVRLVGSLSGEWGRDAEDISYAEYLRRRGHIVEGGDD